MPEKFFKQVGPDLAKMNRMAARLNRGLTRDEAMAEEVKETEAQRKDTSGTMSEETETQKEHVKDGKWGTYKVVYEVEGKESSAPVVAGDPQTAEATIRLRHPNAKFKSTTFMFSGSPGDSKTA